MTDAIKICPACRGEIDMRYTPKTPCKDEFGNVVYKDRTLLHKECTCNGEGTVKG